MPSQFQIEDAMWGTLSIYAIRMNADGTWEKEWDALRNAPDILIDLISQIPYHTYFELRHRHTRPFLNEMGLGPEGCLKKLDESYRMCHHRNTCPSYDPKLCGGHLDPPACYEADVADVEARRLASRLIDLWKMGFHVILVEPDDL